MKFLPRCLSVVALVALLATSAPLFAHDVDGPNDCDRNSHDMGDAPEGSPAYPGVIGHFPTCLAPTAPGTQEFACPPISAPPGPTGFVVNLNLPGNGYWLGCGPAAVGPMGIDTESDAKVNSDGSAFSFCVPTLGIDCVENAFGMKFGQDECYGDDDAGLRDPVVFIPCRPRSVAFRTFSCATFTRHAYLNVLVDWNKDGDWNDNFQCGGTSGGGCAFEWATKNYPIDIPPGCNTERTPLILAGPFEGPGWMRITISDEPVTDDFPWAGSANIPGQALLGGETEDYPVTILQSQDPCIGYRDFGDAPESIGAYPAGVVGNFPTCLTPGGVGTIEAVCPPISTPPGPTGYVEHVSLPSDQFHVWLGCGPPLGPPGGADSEADGKVNVVPPIGAKSTCDPTVIVDCLETAWLGAMTFGQDECYGDDDAGIASPVTYDLCTPSTVSFNTYNCTQQTTEAYVNIMVDWNEDGDWNDNFQCGAAGNCAYEWAVKNAIIAVPPGCTPQVSPTFMSGPRVGHGWMRITITSRPVDDDFPWNGSAGTPVGTFAGGETEDYPVTIRPGDPCQIAYTDFGDAPENVVAYSTGVVGHFPTCIAAGAPGTQEIVCGTALSSPPALTGFVEHAAAATDPIHFWLGCGLATDPTLGVDSEPNGKMWLLGPAAAPQTCDPLVKQDCDQAAWGMAFGQDECYGDVDAGVASFVSFRACSLGAVRYNAYLCAHDPAITAVPAYLNVLVDWNGDGDWNDVLRCGVTGANPACAPEWAVQNVPIFLTPGCNSLVTPNFRVGSIPGQGWMRITLSESPATVDFPWNGTLGFANGAFTRGETEDYPVRIGPSNVGVDDAPVSEVAFAPITPNPASGSTEMRWALPREADVTLAVFDIGGRQVNMLVQRRMPAGQHSMRWDFRDSSGRTLPAGVYVVTLQAGGVSFTRRVIHVH